MIGTAVKELLLEKEDTFMIPADNVANLMVEHPLSHALLVLSQVKYSKIPVLDKEDHFVGLIGLTDIVDKMFDITTVSMEKLNGLTVADVMDTNVEVLPADSELEDILHVLVDAAFIPIVDDEQHFKGIITRRELLKAVNHMVHELEKHNFVIPKLEQSYEKDLPEKLKVG